MGESPLPIRTKLTIATLLACFGFSSLSIGVWKQYRNESKANQIERDFYTSSTEMSEVVQVRKQLISLRHDRRSLYIGILGATAYFFAAFLVHGSAIKQLVIQKDHS